MSLLGETQSDREIPRAPRVDLVTTYKDLDGVLYAAQKNRLDTEQVRQMKVDKGRQILGDAERFKQMGHTNRSKTIGLIGLVVEASQTTNPKIKEKALGDLVGYGFMKPEEVGDLSGFISEVDKVRNRRAADEEYRVNSGPLGGHVMEILAQGERYARTGEELALALKIAAAWSMEDPAFASNVYQGILQDFSEE